jgi:hypothetical protein
VTIGGYFPAASWYPERQADFGQNQVVAAYWSYDEGDVMKYFVGLGVGAAVGTLLATGIMGEHFDWHRALFVGLFVGLAATGLSMLRKKKRDW